MYEPEFSGRTRYPNNKPLESGDVISVDCGAFKNGFHGDHAYSFEIGEVAPETKKLLQVTKESLYVGIREFRLGNRRGRCRKCDSEIYRSPRLWRGS